MPRIIRQPAPKLPIEVECKRCHALIEFGFSEMKFQSAQKDGDYYHAPCPCCNTPICIDTRAVPSWRY